MQYTIYKDIYRNVCVCLLPRACVCVTENELLKVQLSVTEYVSVVVSKQMWCRNKYIKKPSEKETKPINVWTKIIKICTSRAKTFGFVQSLNKHDHKVSSVHA